MRSLELHHRPYSLLEARLRPPAERPRKGRVSAQLQNLAGPGPDPGRIVLDLQPTAKHVAYDLYDFPHRTGLPGAQVTRPTDRFRAFRQQRETSHRVADEGQIAARLQG